MSKSNNSSRVLSAFRWLSFLPVAIAGAIAVRVTVFYINRYTLSHIIPFFLADSLGADSLIGGGTVVLFSDCAMGASFIYIATMVAPKHKRQVTIVVGSIASLLGFSRSLSLFWTEDYWGAFSYCCAAVGALVCSTWFSKVISVRKSATASAALGCELKVAGGLWYSTFQQETESHGIILASNEISGTAKHYINMLQLSAVAATLQENSYVSDAIFFLETVYIVLTGNLPAGLHRDIEALPFALAGDAQRSLSLWAHSMASELSSDKDDQRLIEELSRYGILLVVQAKIATCEACGDHKGAEKMRSFFGS